MEYSWQVKKWIQDNTKETPKTEKRHLLKAQFTTERDSKSAAFHWAIGLFIYFTFFSNLSDLFYSDKLGQEDTFSSNEGV